MSACSINITEMASLVSAAEAAGHDIQSTTGALQGMYSTYEVDGVGRVRGCEEVASWIDQELVGLRRRLEMARAINRSTPGMGNFVQFNEDAISQRTPAQARQDAKDAAQKLYNGDIKGLNAYLKTGAQDPYFAAAFAKLVSPQQLGDFTQRFTGYSGLMPGTDAKQYELALSGLGQTLGLASRGTGDLAMSETWSKNFIQMMTAPPYPKEETSDSLYRHKTDVANRAGLWQIFARGTWSTPLLQNATSSFYKYDKAMAGGAWQQSAAGFSYPVGPNGRPMTDGMVALMSALSHNQEAAKWAFTQGSDTTVPVCGLDTPINGFMHYMLAEHQWIGENEKLGPSSVINAMGVGAAGDKTSPIALDAKTLSDSMREQKAAWDAKPWYEKWGHTILDGLGLVPVIGGVFDAANAGWYSLEGDFVNAGLSAAGIIPFIGEAAVAGKLLKGGKALKALKVVDLDGKTIDEALESAELLKNATSLDGAVFKFDNAADFNRAANNAHPNIVYEFDGIRYQTDSAGRVANINGKPLPKKGLGDPKLRRLIGKSADAKPGDVGFHLWAESFGGPTNALNVVAGNGKVAAKDIARFKNLNTSEYAKMETQIRNALKKKPPPEIHFDVTPRYADEVSKRPARIETRLTIDGRVQKFKFKNAEVNR